MKNESFSCENCGSALRFEPGTNSLKCENCGAEKQLPNVHTARRHRLEEYEERINKSRTEEITVIECRSCGASIQMERHITSGKCPYCNSNIVLSEKLISYLEPDGLRPFTISQKEAGQIFSEWVKKRWFAPNALKTLYQKGKTAGIYLPYWTFDNNADCEYVAEGGRERTETYQENGQAKTRIVVDWYPVRGAFKNHFQDILIRASLSISRNLIENLGGFNLESTVRFDSGYLAGYSSEIFKVPMEAGYQEAKGIMKNELYYMAERDVLRRYDRVRNVRMNVYWSDEFYRLLLLPVYSMSYSFNGKSYQVLINGENGITVGEYPKSFVKIAAAVILAIIILAIIFYFMNDKNF